jgi:cysteine synthase
LELLHKGNEMMARTSNQHGDIVVLLVVLAGASCLIAAATAATKSWPSVCRGRRKSATDHDMMTPVTAYETLIANGTPLVKLEHLSSLLKRSVYVKMESLNPGGTGKDRAALSMIRHAEEEGVLPRPKRHDLTTTTTNTADQTEVSSAMVDLDVREKNESSSTSAPKGEDFLLIEMIRQAMLSPRSQTGGLVVEATSGSTGIALATLCAARGHACLVVMPDDQAVEKQQLLKTLGATVYVVPNAAISNPNHYVNIARKAALLSEDQLGIPTLFGNQFENQANYEIHYRQTGPELWRQCPQLDAFCMSSGTGGTIAGVGTFLKERNPHCQIVVSSPVRASSEAKKRSEAKPHHCVSMHR